jgi:hypothetical protein
MCFVIYWRKAIITAKGRGGMRQMSDLPIGHLALAPSKNGTDIAEIYLGYIQFWGEI